MNWTSFEGHRDPRIQDFTGFPDGLYGGDPCYIPPHEARLIRRFDPRHNPFFEYGTSRQFVAYHDKLPAARCNAAVNPRMDSDGQRVGTIGFFECENDSQLACGLLERALGWLRDEKVTRVYGPMDFSIWGGYRFKTSGFDLEPYLSEPCNKPYYEKLFQAAGFTPCGTWFSTEVDLGAESATVQGKQAKLATRLSSTEQAGYRIVSPNLFRRGERIMKEIYDIVMESYAGFFGFYQITWEEFRVIYGDLRRILRPGQLLLAYRGDQLAGVLIQYWDWAPLMRNCRGKPGLKEALQIRFGPVPGRWVIAIVGIRRASMTDRSGLASALLHRGVSASLDQNASHLIYSLMGEHNRSRSLSCENPSMSRSYTLYQIDT